MYGLLVAIALGAAPRPTPSSPARAVTIAALDCKTLPAKEARFFRYLWLPGRAEDRENDSIVLAFHANLLSDQGAFGTLVQIAPDVLRLDTRDFGWDKRLLVWEKFRDLDPYFHARLKFLKAASIEEVWPGGKSFIDEQDYEAGIYAEVGKSAGDTASIPAPWLPAEGIKTLRHTLLTEVPIVNAEWWFVQTARQISIRNKDEKVGYYQWLGLAKRDDFFKLTGTDPKVASKVFREWRAVVERSGISQQNRQIVALGAASGRVWITLDVFSQTGRGQAKRNLRPGEYLHDVEELIGNLGNGLPVTFLGDKKGVAQASAPDQIGPDDSPLRVGRDARVHANISCWRCHGIDKEFLKPIDDWARRTFKAGGVLQLSDPNKKVTLELKSQYLRDIEKLLTADRKTYSEAIAEVTATRANPKGLTSSQITSLYGKYWNRYVEDAVTVETAARELGTWKWKLQDAIRRHAKLRGQTDLILATWIDETPGTLTRLEWEDQSYAFAQSLVHDLHLPEIEEKGK